MDILKNNTFGLALHFFLEVAAMAAFVHWGFYTGQNFFQKTILALGVPIIAAVLWGVFRVPNDPGPAPVAVPGPLRLLLELIILGGAAAALYFSGKTDLGIVFAAAIVIDYVLMRDRIRKMLS